MNFMILNFVCLASFRCNYVYFAGLMVLNMKPRQQTYNEDLIANENEIHR